MKEVFIKIFIFLGLGMLYTDCISQENNDLDVKHLFTISLEELMNIKVISASNLKEKLKDAPATVIVITKEDIRERGYKELSEIFDDLPGMDIVRPYGDTYYKNYWRGFRNTIGDPFIVMVDGVIQNTMYFGTTSTTMATLPVTHVEKIEVVYGPASSVYGANAFMGTINIITENDKDKDGSYINADMSTSLNNYYFGNVSMFYKKEKIRFSINAHIEDGDLNDKIDNEDFIWLKDKVYQDSSLYGDYLSNHMLNPGEFSSRIRNSGIDIRSYLGNTEIGIRYLLLDTEYGTVYPGDRSTPKGYWPRYLNDYYIRHKQLLNDNLTSTTLFRFRQDGIKNYSSSLAVFQEVNNGNDSALIGDTWVAPGDTVMNVAHTTWHTKNKGVSLSQDFEYNPSDKFLLVSGIKYEIKDLQKAYDMIRTKTFPDSLDASDPQSYSPSSPDSYNYQNRILWHYQSLYIQGKYSLDKNNYFNLGVRYDNNSIYGSVLTFRTNYIRHIDKFSFKIFYGEAYHEPVPRVLYGGWTGSGSDPELDPEMSRTEEFNISYTDTKITTQLSCYYVQNYNTIINFTGGADNVGDRDVLGIDYHITKIIKVPFLNQLKVWAYYSAILHEKELKFDHLGNEIGRKSIGDLAYNKLYFGSTAIFKNHFSVNLRGRYIGERKTVETNPIDRIGDYFVLDANILYKDLFVEGLGLGFKVTNLFNTTYYHPGIRDADSGITPGYWYGRVWYGSEGWYNSKLPQPKRFALLSLMLDF